MPDTIASVLAYEADLTKTIQKTILRDLFVTEDKNAHIFRVKITRSGESVDLTGATVTGYFMRYKDRRSIPLTGTVEGSDAVLTLKDGCYSMRTMFCVTLCVALGGAKHAVFAGEGQMVLNRSDAIVDPENVIPSVEDIIAQYDLMVSGTNAANTAASSANTAAGKANTAASTANTATTNANNATARANTAAAALENAPVPTGTVVTYQAGTSATTPPTGTWLANPPTVPQGQYLWTRTVQSFTNGDPVTGYSVARQGMDGSGSVRSVNSVAPDTAGNVQLDTIANASKLGGKTPEYYLQPRNLLDNSDFTNPVNQRGQTSYSGAGYTIDRWEAGVSACSMNISAGESITFNTQTEGTSAYWRQYLPHPFAQLAGKTFTLAIKCASGEVYCGSGVYPTSAPSSTSIVIWVQMNEGVHCALYCRENSSAMLQLNTKTSLSVVWVALYEGAYTAETLPPYVPKENELAACLLYAIGLPDQMRLRVASVSANTLEVFIPLPCKMRNSGTLPTFDATAFEVRSTSQAAVDGFTFSVVREGNNGILFRATKTAHGLTDGEIRTKVSTILSKDL